MGFILIIRALFLLFILPSLIFGIYATGLYYLAQKVETASHRIILLFCVALAFLLINPVYHTFIMIRPWDLIPDLTIMAMAVLIPFSLMEAYILTRRKEIPVFVCAVLTFLYLFISGFAALSGNYLPSFLDSLQLSDYTFIVLSSLIRFIKELVVGGVISGIILIISRLKSHPCPGR